MTYLPTIIGGGVPATPTGTTAMPFIQGAGAPVDGVTGLNLGLPLMYRDTTNDQMYSNKGTSGAPVWHPFIQG